MNARDVCDEYARRAWSSLLKMIERDSPSEPDWFQRMARYCFMREIKSDLWFFLAYDKEGIERLMIIFNSIGEVANQGKLVRSKDGVIDFVPFNPPACEAPSCPSQSMSADVTIADK